MGKVTGLVILLAAVMIGFVMMPNYSSIGIVHGSRGFGLGPPMVFSGNVYVNGLSVSDGLNVTAWDSSVSSSQAVGSHLTSGGQYSNLVVCGSPDQNCNNGDQITFKLNNQLTATETGTYSAGGSQTLDLHFTGNIATLQATTTPVPTTQSTTVVTVVSTVTTSEYQNVAIIPLLAIMIAVGMIAAAKRRERSK